MPHADWVLDGQRKKSEDFLIANAREQLAQGYVTLILHAINNLEIERARQLLALAKEYFGPPDGTGRSRSQAALEPLIEKVAALVAAGELSLDKPLPHVSSADALDRVRAITGNPHGTATDYLDGISWRIEQILRGPNGRLFEVEVSQHGHTADNPGWYLETYFQRYHLVLRDAYLKPILEVTEMTLAACLTALQSRLAEIKPTAEEREAKPETGSK